MSELRIAEASEYARVDEIARAAGLPAEWSSEAALGAGMIFIVGEAAFLAVRELGDRKAEIYVVVAPAWRGKTAFDAARVAITAIFETCDVDELIACMEPDDRRARTFAAAVGFERVGPHDATARLSRKDWIWPVN